MRIEQEYAVVPVDAIREHPQNPNRGDDGVVAESVETNGWYGACIVQKSTGFILAGNTRYRVAKASGAEQVPVIYRDVDDQTALRIMLVDNESARQAEMDEELVTQLLESLDTLDGTGYGLTRLEGQLEGVSGPEEASEGEEEGLEVPDDVYTPTFGVMLVLDSEERQAEVYQWLSEVQGQYADHHDRILDGVKLRVVAV